MSPPTSHDGARIFPRNQDGGETRMTLIIGVEVPTTTVMLSFVLARFYMRAFIKKVLGVDDWVMGVAAVILTAMSIMNCVNTRYFLGLHSWEVTPSMLAPTAKMGYISIALFVACTSLTKISMCLTYLRILYIRSDKIFCYCALIFITGSWISVTSVIILMSVRLQKPWDLGTSLNQEAAIVASACLNSASDFLIFLWPSRTLWNVRLPTKQRFGLVFVFGLGCIVCIAGVCRIVYSVRFFKSNDPFYDGAVIYVICAIEASVGIICGCLPSLKPFLARYFPGVFGTSWNHSSKLNARSSKSLPLESLPGRRNTAKLHRSVSAEPMILTRDCALNVTPSLAPPVHKTVSKASSMKTVGSEVDAWSGSSGGEARDQELVAKPEVSYSGRIY